MKKLRPRGRKEGAQEGFVLGHTGTLQAELGLGPCSPDVRSALRSSLCPARACRSLPRPGSNAPVHLCVCTWKAFLPSIRPSVSNPEVSCPGNLGCALSSPVPRGFLYAVSQGSGRTGVSLFPCPPNPKAVTPQAQGPPAAFSHLHPPGQGPGCSWRLRRQCLFKRGIGL